MKLSPLSRRLVLGALIWLAGAASSALTLGRVQGVPLVGRPLDVTVQVGADGSAADASVCAQAEVFYGDTRIDPGRITTQEISTNAGANVRVRASPAIDEPVVTVYLQIGCTAKVTRRYVVLAEYPSEMVNEPAPARAPAAAIAPRMSRPVETPPRAAATAPAKPAAAASPAGAAPPAPAAAAPAGTTARAAPLRKASPQPRLKLDPLDLSLEQEPSLRLSTQLASAPTATPQQRQQAAALWRLLNAGPEETLREGQRIQSLEADVRSLRHAMQLNNSALSDLRGELLKAQAERYANPLVYVLLAIALAAVVFAAYAWRRNRWHATAGPDWWRGAEAGAQDTGFGTAAAAPSAAAPARAAKDTDSADLDLSFTHSTLERLNPRTAVAPGTAPHASRRPADFQDSQSASLRSVKPEELHDVQQEADFFVSLGEYERAIEVLRSHINQKPETSPLVWLDLLEIFHKLQRREDYEAVRAEFNSIFNAQVPSFEAYREEGLGLESYPKALSRIVALWPSRRVLELIEQSIFRKPGRSGVEAFSLEAYRELLLLHHIGRELINGRTPDFAPSSRNEGSDFSHTAVHPLSASFGHSMVPPSSIAHSEFGQVQTPSMGLDINLDEPSPPSADFVEIGWAESVGTLHGAPLDFDLPEIDTTQFKTKKTRE